MLVVVSAIPCWLGKSNPVNLAEGITAGTAVIALLVAVASIIFTINQRRETLTYEYIARTNEPTLVKYRIKTVRFINLERPVPDLETEWADMSEDERIGAKLQQWEDWHQATPEDQADALVYLNLLEEIGAAYRLGLLHKPSLKLHLEAVSVTYWELASWFIKDRRIINAEYFNQWEFLQETLAANDPKRRIPWAAWLGAWGTCSASSWCSR